MKAMILAAGLGTRLRPLTNSKPKALIEINKIPLLEIVIKRLKLYDFNEIIINVHHFADQIIGFLKEKNNFSIDIRVSDETDLLLSTGGGLKKASWFFNDNKPFLVHNVDILSDINLKQFYRAHINSEALATLAVRNRQSSRYLLFDNENNLCGWKNTKTNELKIAIQSKSDLIPLAFSGIHIINPSIFDLMPEQHVFSMIDVYLNLAANYSIKEFNHDSSMWIDIGTKESLIEANKILDQIKEHTP
ncbi:MAG: nucleotidyltransferase family protein [Candidatus Marinimicrobia bacterium]|nr:nucleotidyltransferase family protein [Candidatus Neomarinimicrobiota bacterium]